MADSNEWNFDPEQMRIVLAGLRKEVGAEDPYEIYIPEPRIGFFAKEPSRKMEPDTQQDDYESKCRRIAWAGIISLAIMNLVFVLGIVFGGSGKFLAIGPAEEALIAIVSLILGYSTWRRFIRREGTKEE